MKWRRTVPVRQVDGEHCRGEPEVIKGELEMKAEGRRICGTDEEFTLRQFQTSYSDDFEAENGLLSTKNACF